MSARSPTLLARALRDFFAVHLPCLRGMSPHTIHSYRDSITLLLRFVVDRYDPQLAELDVEDVTAPRVICFLQHLEDERRNTAATRNVRLSAIHAFFRYFAGQHPDRLEHCQRVLGVPFKRTRAKAIEYLEYDEIQAVLAAIDRTKRDGRRDYALLATMFNTGARVQEILDLRARDLQLVKPFHARLVGKGRKERICPLWPQTAQLLSALLAEFDLQTPEPSSLATASRSGDPRRSPITASSRSPNPRSFQYEDACFAHDQHRFGDHHLMKSPLMDLPGSEAEKAISNLYHSKNKYLLIPS